LTNDDFQDREEAEQGHEQWLTFWQRRVTGIYTEMKEAQKRVEESHELETAEPDPVKKLALMKNSIKHLKRVTELIGELKVAQSELEKAIANDRGSE
jgi:hypothetical protein